MKAFVMFLVAGLFGAGVMVVLTYFLGGWGYLLGLPICFGIGWTIGGKL